MASGDETSVVTVHLNSTHQAQTRGMIPFKAFFGLIGDECDGEMAVSGSGGDSRRRRIRGDTNGAGDFGSGGHLVDVLAGVPAAA
jgi:hypothetical protein